NRVSNFTMPNANGLAMFFPKRTVRRLKSFLSVGQIYLQTREQSFRAIKFTFFFIEFLIEPASRIFASLRGKNSMHFRIIARPEFFNLLLALDEDRQRRRLHTTDRRQMKTAGLGIKRRHRARAVDADEPVALAAARRGVRERNHFTVRAQVREAVANRGGRHGLQPEPLDWLLGFGV